MNEAAARSSTPGVTDGIATARSWINLPLWGLLALSAVAIGYFLFVGYRVDFHSDSAIKSLIAGEIVDNRDFFPDDWTYVNGDLWVLFGHLFIIPLLGVLPNGYSAHAVSGLVSAALILGSLWLLSGKIIRSTALRLLPLCLVSGGLSIVGTENLYGQVSYGAMIYQIAFSAYFLLKWRDSTTRNGRLLWLGLVCLGTALLFWANPQRAMAYVALPAIVGMFSEAVSPVVRSLPGQDGVISERAGLQWIPAVVAMIIAAAIGVLLHATSLRGVNNIQGASSANWLDYGTLSANLGKTVHGLLGILGGLPEGGLSVFSLAGAYAGLRLVVACMIVLLIPSAAVALLSSVRPTLRFFAGFSGTLFAVFVFLQATTTVADMSDPLSSSRYMIPGVIFGLFAIAAWADEGVPARSSPKAWVLAGVLALLLPSLFLPSNPLSRLFYGVPVDSRTKLIAELEQRGLSYGYATYWNAPALTVLSDEKLRIRQVQVERGGVVPMRHLSSNQWYRPEAWTGKTFLLLSESEAKEMVWPAFYSQVGEPIDQFNLDGFNVRVFSGNIAQSIPSWNDRGIGHTPLRLKAGATTLHQVGQLAADQHGPLIASGAGESGFVHFGPYVKMLPGQYVAYFDVEAAPKAAGFVDVVAAAGTQVLARQDIAPGFSGVLKLAFPVKEEVTDAEFRVFSNGAGSLGVHGVQAGSPARLPCMSDVKGNCIAR